MTNTFRLQFREWLTLEEAAEVLCQALPGEKLRVADVLRLALDGELELSVNLPGTHAMCYEPGKEEGKMSRHHIHGVWELPMVGSGRRQIEHEFNRHQGLSHLSMEDTDGAFVRRDDLICRVPTGEGSSGLWPGPASALPADATLVVRTEALRELTAKFIKIRTEADREALGPKRAKNASGSDAPIGSREKATLLTIIAALAEAAKIDISQPSKAGSAIESLTSQIGARVAARTIEDHLKAVPDALERRGRGSK